jgi:hypothetical protein
MASPIPDMNGFMASLLNRIQSQDQDIQHLKRRVCELTNAVNQLESVKDAKDANEPVVTPQNPKNVSYDATRVKFGVDNAQYVEFVDIRVDETTWVQRWAPWSPNPGQKFDLSGSIITVDIAPVVANTSLEIFTRYDKFTKNTNAGFAKHTVTPVPVVPEPVSTPADMVFSGDRTAATFTFTPKSSSMFAFTQYSCDNVSYFNCEAPFSVSSDVQTVVKRNNIPDHIAFVRIVGDANRVLVNPVHIPSVEPVDLMISGNRAEMTFTYTPTSSCSMAFTQYSSDGFVYSSYEAPFSVTSGIQTMTVRKNIPTHMKFVRIVAGGSNKLIGKPVLIPTADAIISGTTFPVKILDVSRTDGTVRIASTQSFPGDGISGVRLVEVGSGSRGSSVPVNEGESTVSFNTGALIYAPSGSKWQLHATKFGWDPITADSAVSQVYELS